MDVINSIKSTLYQGDLFLVLFKVLRGLIDRGRTNFLLLERVSIREENWRWEIKVRC